MGTVCLTEILGDLTAFIVAHRDWAGPIIALLVFGESLAVIGMFFPATPIMFAIGGMMGAGSLDPVRVGLWAIAGAILGDWVSYSLGRGIGPSIYYRRPFVRHRAAFAKARLFFQRYGFASIFIGRFLGPVRATVPLVAGVVGMPRRTFQLSNILSACAWVPASFAPGYIAIAGIWSTRLMGQADLVAVGGVIALLFLLASVFVAILGVRRRSRRRAAGDGQDRDTAIGDR